MFRSGSWYLHSDKDRRWNVGGDSDCVGCFTIPKEAREKIEEFKGIYGKPPKDLEWGYMKD